jgi:hypothetical protein
VTLFQSDHIWSSDRPLTERSTFLAHPRLLASGQPIAFLRWEEYQKMPLLNIVVMLIVVGLGLYLINRFIPMASSIKSILNVVVVVVVSVWLLKVFGLWDSLSSYRVR